MEELIIQAKSGDITARDELLSQVRSRLRQWSESALSERFNSRLDASDLTQLTLLDVFQKLDQFAGTSAGELDSWLRTALRRNILDAVRDATAKMRSVHREHAASAEPNEQAPALIKVLKGNTPTPSVLAMRKEGSAQLQRALEMLPPDYREVIRLVHLQGYSLASASLQMDRTLGATAKLLQRAIAKLRKQLESNQ